jgi:hypothetical protein
MEGGTLSSLTTMLHRSGLLGDEALARLEAHCQAKSRAPVAGVADLGLLDEPRMVEFLQNRMMIPRADAAVLDRVDVDTLARVPAEVAWNHLVLPVSIDDDGNLTLAMADPTDTRTVSEVTGLTGAYLIRAVAGLSELEAAVKRHYGPAPPPPTAQTSEATVSTEPLSPQAFAVIIPELEAATDRDAITRKMLDFLAAGFRRVILFIHLRNQLQGRDGRGEDLLLEAVTQVRIPTTSESLFSDVIGHGVPFWGPWPTQRPTDAAFAQAMGGIEGLALLMPVRLRDKTPLLVFAAGTDRAVNPGAFQELARATSSALEKILLRRSSQTNLPKVE